MATYLYCLLRATSEPPAGLTGVDGVAVRSVTAGDVGSWVSDLSGASLTPTVERARQHDHVVAAALPRETPLPARFGQVLADDNELRQLLDARQTTILQSLDEVAGMVEMTVRILLPRTEEATPAAGPEDGESTGRAYLERLGRAQRAAERQRASGSALLARLRTAVEGIARREAVASSPPGSVVLSISHLVERDQVEAYRRAARQLHEGDAGLRLMVSGPWAPYSFAELPRE